MKLNSGLLALWFGLAGAGAASSAQADLLIRVDKAAQRMTVTVDGVQRHVWPVSTGRSGYITPSGSFTPFRLEEDHYSKEWDDAPMPHSVFFTKEGHAIHGSFDTKRLGSPASHGCVRLAPANAAALFALVKQEGLGNTKVVLQGETPSSAPAVARRDKPAGAPLALAPQAEPVDIYARGPAYRAPAPYYEQRTSPYYEQRTAPSYPRRVYVYPDGRMVESWN
jgi:hypothetical protein